MSLLPTCPSNGTSRSRPSLSQDTRGAILVLGVVFGMVLFGALWNLASVGDAIIWRERAQDAADATAFHSATFHARGMNMIVMVNLIMAVIMAVFIVWKITLAALTLATAALCVTSVFAPVLGGACLKMLDIEQKALEADPRIGDATFTVINGLSASQKVLATGSPILATTQSIGFSTSTFREVRAGGALSIAMLPRAEDVMSLYNRLRKRDSSAAPGGEKKPPGLNPRFAVRLGPGVSLPVQSEHYNVLCQRGGELLPWALSHVIPVPDLLSGWFGRATGNAPWLFCKSWFGGKVDPSKIKVAKPWELFENGGLAGQTFGAVYAPRTRVQTNDEGLRIADGPHAADLSDPNWSFSFAQAEYYSDCDAGWESCRSPAMWTFGWRARLRRLQPLTLIGGVVERALYVGPGQILNKFIGEYMNYWVKGSGDNAWNLVITRELRDWGIKQTERGVGHLGIAQRTADLLARSRESTIH